MKKKWLVSSICAFGSILGLGLVWWFLGGSEAIVLRGLNKSEKKIALVSYQRGLKDNVPIHFYGKVVDQEGKAIGGIKVKAEIHMFDENLWHWRTEKYDEKVVTLNITTDQNGKIVIENVRGRDLVVAFPRQPGLEIDFYAPMSFNYSPRFQNLHHPDPANPVIFHAWRKGMSEPLVASKKGYMIPADGSIVTIDLLKLKKYDGSMSEGDLRVRVVSPATVDPKIHYEWSFVIEPVDGGIVETDGIFLYRAPDTGYQPRFEFTMNHNDLKWKDAVKKKFYVKTRSGKVYASMEIKVGVGYDGGAAFEARCLANPAGSRNLEYDPAKRINVDYGYLPY